MSGHDGGVGGRSAGQSSADNLLIVGPDDAPDVEEHDDSHAAADTDRKHVIVISADRGVVHEYPACRIDQDRGDGSEHVSAGHDFLITAKRMAQTPIHSSRKSPKVGPWPRP